MNFRNKQVLKKRHDSLEKLASLLMEFLKLCLTILLRLLLVGNSFLTLKDLFFLENKYHQVPLIGKMWVKASDNVDTSFFWLDGVAEKVLPFFQVCDLNGWNKIPFTTAYRCDRRRCKVNGRLKHKPLTIFHFVDVDCVGYTSGHFSVHFLF